MKTILESVINFSEGRNPDVIKKIEAAIKAVPNVVLMHSDMGYDANRTVVTFAGVAENLIEAAFKAIETATEWIDMRLHHGEHPRIGATDVVPIVPLAGATLAEAKLWADRLARRVANELNIPIYLYAENATTLDRKRLPFIRIGDYEGLPKRMAEGFLPDYGPTTLPPKSGATVIGARNLMIAFNINLKSENVDAASQIAKRLRTSGYKETLPNGDTLHHPGKLVGLQAKGWLMEHYHCAQVTTNIHDIQATPPHLLYKAISDEAQKLGEAVAGCELIGLIPRHCLIDAGRFALQTKSSSSTDEQLQQIGIDFLGLNSVREFDPQKQIIEERLQFLI